MQELNQTEEFYVRWQEPVRSCMLALKDLIMNTDPEVKTAIKYGMPFFFWGKRRFCYIWYHKKLRQPYIGFTEGIEISFPELLTEGRTKMKILPVDPEADLPADIIRKVLETALENRKIKIN